MTCEFVNRIGDYADGALPAAEAARVEAHVPQCATCAALLADIRSIQSAARVLQRHAPPPEVWTRIARQVAQEPAAPAPRSWWQQWQPLAAAAVLVVVVAGGWLLSEPRQDEAMAVAEAPAPQADVPAAAGAASPALEDEIQLAENNLTETIAGLEQIARADVNALDQETADIVQANLTVIDAAIGESRVELQAEPTNELAQQSLFDALQSKVTLLQDTISLINEMRKANTEGTARIVSEMNP